MRDHYDFSKMKGHFPKIILLFLKGKFFANRSYYVKKNKTKNWCAVDGIFNIRADYVDFRYSVF